jgi:molybdenum cofactor cytidylyltransferase
LTKLAVAACGSFFLPLFLTVFFTPLLIMMLPMDKSVGAIVLAAGFSKRFGGIKLLATLADSSTVIAQTMQRINAALENTVVITRPELLPLLSPYGLNLKVFEHADLGMGATLAYGMEFAQQWSGCLVCLADMPFIASSTYQTLADQITADSIIIPSYQSRAGNPVGFGSRWFTQLAQLDGDSGGRTVIKKNPEAVRYIPVDDLAIFNDIDTPDDLSRYQPQDIQGSSE